MCTHMLTCTNICTHIHISTHICTHTYTHAHAFTHTHTGHSNKGKQDRIPPTPFLLTLPSGLQGSLTPMLCPEGQLQRAPTSPFSQGGAGAGPWAAAGLWQSSLSALLAGPKPVLLQACPPWNRCFWILFQGAVNEKTQ